METSPSTKELTAALLAFQPAGVRVAKDAQNPAFRSKYASIASILEAIAEPLLAARLSVVQFPDGDGLTTRLQHESGEWMQATGPLRAVQQTPQALGSALTYARRYALCAVLSLVVDDDDGQAASAPAPAPKLASDAQKNEIRRLVAHESISAAGQEKTLAELHQMSAARADKVLAGLKEHIAQHEAEPAP